MRAEGARPHGRVRGCGTGGDDCGNRKVGPARGHPTRQQGKGKQKATQEGRRQRQEAHCEAHDKHRSQARVQGEATPKSSSLV